jgi:antitoxin component YwqK of YwqJK toxin-antitoxin module
LKKVIFFITFQVLFLLNVSALCRSKEFTQENYNSLGAIFIGTIIEDYYDQRTGLNLVKFSVKKLYKGEIDDGYIYAQSGPSVKDRGIDFLFLIDEFNGQNYFNDNSYKIKIDNEIEFKLPEWLIPYLNKQDGYHKSFYTNGRLSSEGILKTNKPQGLWKYYDTCGNLTSTGAYESGKHDSIWNYTMHSILGSYKISYKDGKMDGPNISYDNYAGFTETERAHYNYKGGSRNGKFHEMGLFYKNLQLGSISFYYLGGEGEYLNDKLVWSISYYEDGTKAEFRSDSLEVKWNRMGTKIYETILKKRSMIFLQSWWDNGKPRLIMKSNEWREDRVIFASKEDGTIMVKDGNGFYNIYGQSGFYKDTLKSGVWLQEFNNGRITLQEYKKGMKHGKYREMDKNGVLIEKGTYKWGKSIGYFRSWYSNGQKRSKTRMDGFEYIIISFWNPQGKKIIKKGNGSFYYYDYDGKANSASRPIEYLNGKACN